MSNRLRTELYRKIRRCFETVERPGSANSALSVLELRLDGSSGEFYFSLPVRTTEWNLRNAADLEPDRFLSRVSLRKEKATENILLHLHRDQCVKAIAESDPSNVSIPDFNEGGRRIIVEYSSPNIAKPFHVGHLRSTIIGNCVANLNHFLGHDVRRINYLGDWGTQFGFVQLGVDLLGVSEEAMQRDPIRMLYEAYVHANKLAETDESVAARARAIFSGLESGEGTDLGKWEAFRRFTVDELRRTYERLGVSFDEYNWESTYNAKKLSPIITLMESRGLLVTDGEQRRVVALNEKRNIPILKSDGSTLYVTRDIAAAVDRFEKHNFDAMYYVVDNAQTDHFTSLRKILERMELSWADRLEHVKFGRIRGMSTRKGAAVFLTDILDETRAVMRENQIRSPNTKVLLDSNDPSTDVLGISAVIVNDLKQRRMRDYQFDWDRALDVKGDTGVKLQYVHCRLTSLEDNCGATLPSECDPTLLREPIVLQLLLEIGRFDQAVIKSHRELEPCVLVNYLFGLSTVVNKGLKLLRIKGEPADVGSQRLLVFHAAKKVLSEGMKLLGLQPLNKM